jgi:hypothetical protein
MELLDILKYSLFGTGVVCLGFTYYVMLKKD